MDEMVNVATGAPDVASGLGLVQGMIVTALVSAVRRFFGAKQWGEYGPMVKLGVVAVVATVWAGMTGWLGLGYSGLVLGKHVLAAFLGALGIRQVVKQTPLSTSRKAKEAHSIKTKLKM
jgi:hypothetical protein